MTWEIAFVLGLLAFAVAMFVKERVPPDVTALTLFAVLLVTGVLPQERVFSVLSNPAPLTIGAMFILSAALVRCGVIDRVATALKGLAGWSYFTVVMLVVLGVGVVSAFVNNTPVVVVMVPIILSLAARMKRAPSKLLIPLSYAAVMGGTCTLIGTSTNLLVAGVARSQGVGTISMFELAQVGVPLMAAGALYIGLLGWKFLPVRQAVGASMAEEENREYLTEMFVQPGAAAVGQTLAQAGLVPSRGVRVLELIRQDVAQALDNRTKLEPGDRLYLACRPKGVAHARSIDGLDLTTELNLPLRQISAHEGIMVECVVGPNSEMIGRTVEELDLIQRHRLVVLAVHCEGRDVREKVGDLRLKFGDILLVMGTEQAVENLRGGRDLLLIDRPPVPSRNARWQMFTVLGSIAAVVLSASVGWLSVEVAAIIACVVIFLTGCLKPKDGYRAIEWNLLFLIWGMLAVGLAMQDTGTSAFIIQQILRAVDLLAPPEYRPIIMLAAVYLVATTLTEILSNNAIAALMAPLVISLAAQLGVDSKPFLIALCVAASASFATPIGYQTNTYVYGIGGYQFADFMKFGIPLNLLYFVGAIWLIPYYWPF
jgi:di/tricarboxylate transporter